MNINAPTRDLPVVYTNGTETVYEGKGLAARGVDVIIVNNGDPTNSVVFDSTLNISYQPNKKLGVGLGFYKADSRPGTPNPLRVHFVQTTIPDWVEDLTEVKF